MSFIFLLKMLACLFLFLFILFSLTTKKNKAKKLLPSPRKLPIVGNLHQLGKLPHRSLQKLSHEYGDFIFLQLGSIPTLLVSSADVAKEIFRVHDVAFAGRPPLYAAKRLSYNCCNVSFAPYGKLLEKILFIYIIIIFMCDPHFFFLIHEQLFLFFFYHDRI